MRKTIAYIDGRNVHHSLADKDIDGYAVDYKKLVCKIIKNADPLTIKFYGARYPRELDAVKHNRDDAFYQHLTNAGVIVRFGQFKIVEDGAKRIPLEKGVDVLLATDLLLDTMYSNYEDAFIFSSDTDLIPAIAGARAINKSVQIHNVAVCRFSPQEFTDSCHSVRALYTKLARKCVSTDFRPTQATLNDLVAKFDKGRGS